MRTITLEEHYATPAFMEGPGRDLKAQAEAARGHPQVAAGFAKLIEELCDLDEGRIAAMDAAGIDVQVLSLTSPGTEQLDAAEAVAFARETNDHLAEAVRRHPSRLAGFAAVPIAVPEAAADELERTIREYGFRGALINGHARGRYLDDGFFWPILERAEALGVPIYLHPTPPPRAVIEASYAGNYAPGVTGLLATAGWGWHIETATHVLRLVLGGAFDRYPGLQLVIGHLGEGLPFMLPRLEMALPKEATGLDRPVGDYLRENVHYTFGGFNWTPAFLDLLLQVGADRIMFSTDHPYASMAQARAFLDGLPVSPADKAKIAHSNAKRLLRLFRGRGYEAVAEEPVRRVDGRSASGTTRRGAAGEPLAWRSDAGFKTPFSSPSGQWPGAAGNEPERSARHHQRRLAYRGGHGGSGARRGHLNPRRAEPHPKIAPDGRGGY